MFSFLTLNLDTIIRVSLASKGFNEVYSFVVYSLEPFPRDIKEFDLFLCDYWPMLYVAALRL